MVDQASTSLEAIHYIVQGEGVRDSTWAVSTSAPLFYGNVAGQDAFQELLIPPSPQNAIVPIVRIFPQDATPRYVVAPSPSSPRPPPAPQDPPPPPSPQVPVQNVPTFKPAPETIPVAVAPAAALVATTAPTVTAPQQQVPHSSHTIVRPVPTNPNCVPQSPRDTAHVVQSSAPASAVQSQGTSITSEPRPAAARKPVEAESSKGSRKDASQSASSSKRSRLDEVRSREQRTAMDNIILQTRRTLERRKSGRMMPPLPPLITPANVSSEAPSEPHRDREAPGTDRRPHSASAKNIETERSSDAKLSTALSNSINASLSRKAPPPAASPLPGSSNSPVERSTANARSFAPEQVSGAGRGTRELSKPQSSQEPVHIDSNTAFDAGSATRVASASEKSGIEEMSTTTALLSSGGLEESQEKKVSQKSSLKVTVDNRGGNAQDKVANRKAGEATGTEASSAATVRRTVDEEHPADHNDQLDTRKAATVPKRGTSQVLRKPVTLQTSTMRRDIHVEPFERCMWLVIKLALRMRKHSPGMSKSRVAKTKRQMALALNPRRQESGNKVSRNQGAYNEAGASSVGPKTSQEPATTERKLKSSAEPDKSMQERHRNMTRTGHDLAATAGRGKSSKRVETKPREETTALLGVERSGVRGIKYNLLNWKRAVQANEADVTRIVQETKRLNLVCEAVQSDLPGTVSIPDRDIVDHVLNTSFAGLTILFLRKEADLLLPNEQPANGSRSASSPRVRQSLIALDHIILWIGYLADRLSNLYKKYETEQPGSIATRRFHSRMVDWLGLSKNTTPDNPGILYAMRMLKKSLPDQETENDGKKYFLERQALWSRVSIAVKTFSKPLRLSVRILEESNSEPAEQPSIENRTSIPERAPVAVIPAERRTEASKQTNIQGSSGDHARGSEPARSVPKSSSQLPSVPRRATQPEGVIEPSKSAQGSSLKPAEGSALKPITSAKPTRAVFDHAAVVKKMLSAGSEGGNSNSKLSSVGKGSRVAVDDRKTNLRGVQGPQEVQDVDEDDENGPAKKKSKRMRVSFVPTLVTGKQNSNIDKDHVSSLFVDGYDLLGSRNELQQEAVNERRKLLSRGAIFGLFAYLRSEVEGWKKQSEGNPVLEPEFLHIPYPRSALKQVARLIHSENRVTENKHGVDEDKHQPAG